MCFSLIRLTLCPVVSLSSTTKMASMIIVRFYPSFIAFDSPDLRFFLVILRLVFDRILILISIRSSSSSNSNFCILCFQQQARCRRSMFAGLTEVARSFHSSVGEARVPLLSPVENQVKVKTDRYFLDRFFIYRFLLYWSDLFFCL